MNKRELVFDRKLGALRPLAPSASLSSSALGWRGVRLEQHSLPCLEPSESFFLNHAVVVQEKSPIMLHSKCGSQTVLRRILPGQVSILPSRMPAEDYCPDPLQFVCVSLEPNFLKSASSEITDVRELDLQMQYGIEDHFIQSVCHTLKKEVEMGGPSGRLYAETLATGLAVHLVAKYSQKKQKILLPEKGGLSPQSMRKAVDYVQAHLSENFALEDLAAATGLSKFHFARLFKKTAGMSPHQFVLKQRIERAKHLMLQGQAPLMEIALEVGFFDQSHFNHHFKRMNGVTPGEYMRQLKAA